MTDFFTPDEILAVNDGSLPENLRSFTRYIVRNKWRKDKDKARQRSGRGRVWEYHISLLPKSIQTRLILQQENTQKTKIEKASSKELWEAFEKKSKKHKDEAQRRLKILQAIEDCKESGLTECAAISSIAQRFNIASSTINNWKAKVIGFSRTDWLPVLTPDYKNTAKRAECNERAYIILKSDYLRDSESSFSACYRRMKDFAKKEGLEPIPSERAMRRRLNNDVPIETQKLAREGRDTLKALYPAQRRDRSDLHAMQAVNMDGHKLDVFVKMPDREKPTRVFLVTIQDLYSNKHLAWRLTEAENKETVRLVIGDMVENYGIPEDIVLDNGRSFASKWITGGTSNRFRYKIKDEDPQGLLTTLGVKVHWTMPYSGQSKPIERSFRDLADEIAKHPFCAGAYTGNKPENQPESYGTKAIPYDQFEEHVNHQIEKWNAREGRSTDIANGRSYDDIFSESYSNSIIRTATQAQRSLWLLAAERIRTRKNNGEIHIFDNRYWHKELVAHAGKNVVVRFDPQKLHSDIRVYDLNDQLICVAGCIADVGFFDVDAAREQSRKRNAYMKNAKANLILEREMNPEELGEIYAPSGPIETVKKKEHPKVSRIVPSRRSNLAVKEDRQEAEQWEEEMQQGFANSLTLIAGGISDE